MTEPEQLTWRHALEDLDGLFDLTDWMRETVMAQVQKQVGKEQGQAWLQAYICATPAWYKAEPSLRQWLLWLITHDDFVMELAPEKYEEFESRMALVMMPEASALVN